jgi:hypothetical protein
MPAWKSIIAVTITQKLPPRFYSLDDEVEGSIDNIRMAP